MTAISPREYRQAVRDVNCVNPASWSNGRITDLTSLLTAELSIDLQYTDNDREMGTGVSATWALQWRQLEAMAPRRD